jgi:hypothetical protein
LALDFGAAYVTIELGEIHSGDCAVSLNRDRRIVIDPRNTGPANLTATLLHECLHQIDDLFLGGYLGGAEDSPEHKRLDVLANCLDMLWSRNFKVFKELYEAKQMRKTNA